MTGFELYTSGVRSNRSTNCATTTFYNKNQSPYAIVSCIMVDGNFMLQQVASI